MNATDLASRLARHGDAGLYRLPAGRLADLEAAADALGLEHVRADLSDCRDKPALLARIAEALRFPEWFGHNWDALADCLTDLDWMPARGYVIVLDGADALRTESPAEFAAAVEILAESAHDWAERGTPMWIFVGLAGDDPSLPDL